MRHDRPVTDATVAELERHAARAGILRDHEVTVSTHSLQALVATYKRLRAAVNNDDFLKLYPPRDIPDLKSSLA